jgi:hypothetical protein
VVIDLAKTVYLGHDGGAGCPGFEAASGPVGSPVTYCFVVTNTGGTYLDTLTFTDADLGIGTGDLTLLSGTQPLAPGASLVWYYESTIAAPLVNTATVGGTPTDSGGTPIPGLPHPSDSDTAQVMLPEDIINICQHVCLSKLQPKARSLDRQLLQFATLPIPPIDPTTAPFRVTISTANGVVYDQSIPAGAIQASKNDWIYRNGDAARLGGFAQVRIYRITVQVEMGRPYVRLDLDVGPAEDRLGDLAAGRAALIRSLPDGVRRSAAKRRTAGPLPGPAPTPLPARRGAAARHGCAPRPPAAAGRGRCERDGRWD